MPTNLNKPKLLDNHCLEQSTNQYTILYMMSMFVLKNKNPFANIKQSMIN